MKKVINDTIHNWVNNHSDLLQKYKGKWVAFTVKDSIIAVADTIEDIKIRAGEHSEKFTIFFVNPNFFKVRF